LGRWGKAPLELLEEGAALGKVFKLKLWRRVVVGYSPAWNRLVLGGLDTFRSRRSLSALSPYLAGGVVLTDHPEHKPRRAELNPHMHARALEPLRERLAEAVARQLPSGRFEALEWSLETVPALLNEAFFGGAFPPRLFSGFFAPLHRNLPGPLLPRPLLFRRVNAQIERFMETPSPETLAAHLAPLENAVEEIRVALGAAFDTTAHSLAWALWHLASHPCWRTPEALPLVIKETLRLYPAGWLGSRITSRAFEFEGRTFPQGLMIFYSPYLTHHDPDLWSRPYTFDPERFTARRPPWGYLPFSGGERTCLGMHLANLMLELSLAPFLAGELRILSGDASARTGLTLSPRGPLWLEWAREDGCK
jgi:cytochrome P450